MAKIPVGIPDAVIIRELAALEAMGEINNVPPPRLTDILAKAREKMELKEKPPVGPPPPPPAVPARPRAPGSPEPVVLVIRQPTP